MTNQQKLIADLIAAKLNYTGPMEQLHAILQLYVDAGVPAAAPPQPEPSAVPAPAAEQKPKPAPAPKPAAKRQLLLSDCKLPVSGFLHLRCPSCGSIRTFCAKQPISAYICRACDATSPLSSLTRVRQICECGKASTYRTNLDEWYFDLPCIQCKSPVAMEYHPKKNCYETIGRSGRQRK